jgi:hypothetical protein
VPTSYSPSEAIECVNSYIEKRSSENLSVDIAFLNAIDSAYVSTICSSKHFIKYPDGKISWIVSSKLVKDFTKDFNLGNAEYVY